MFFTFLEISLIFEFIALIMAFLIFYNDYEKHFPTKKKAFIESIKASLIVFLFLFILFTIVIIILVFHK